MVLLLSFKFLLGKKIVSIYFLKRLQEILSLNMLFNLKLLAKHEFCLKSVSAEKRVILDASSYPLGVWSLGEGRQHPEEGTACWFGPFAMDYWSRTVVWAEKFGKKCGTGQGIPELRRFWWFGRRNQLHYKFGNKWRPVVSKLLKPFSILSTILWGSLVNKSSWK